MIQKKKIYTCVVDYFKLIEPFAPNFIPLYMYNSYSSAYEILNKHTWSFDCQKETTPTACLIPNDYEFYHLCTCIRSFSHIGFQIFSQSKTPGYIDNLI